MPPDVLASPVQSSEPGRAGVWLPAVRATRRPARTARTLVDLVGPAQLRTAPLATMVVGLVGLARPGSLLTAIVVT